MTFCCSCVERVQMGQLQQLWSQGWGLLYHLGDVCKTQLVDCFARFFFPPSPPSPIVKLQGGDGRGLTQFIWEVRNAAGLGKRQESLKVFEFDKDARRWSGTEDRQAGKQMHRHTSKQSEEDWYFSKSTVKVILVRNWGHQTTTKSLFHYVTRHFIFEESWVFNVIYRRTLWSQNNNKGCWIISILWREIVLDPHGRAASTTPTIKQSTAFSSIRRPRLVNYSFSENRNYLLIPISLYPIGQRQKAAPPPPNLPLPLQPLSLDCDGDLCDDSYCLIDTHIAHGL